MARRFSIEPFQTLPGEAEIVGIGRIRQSCGPALEPEFEIILSISQEDGTTLCSRWVGAGQLDLLTVGSLWSKGRFTGYAPMEEFSATVTPRMPELFGKTIEPDWHEEPKPSPSRLARLPCFRLACSFDDGLQDDRRPDALLVPKVELARALFAVSSQFILELFDGVRDPSISNDRGAFDRKKSFRAADGSVRIRATKKLRRAEAILAAILITNKGISTAHNLVFQALSLASSWRHSKPTWVEMEWPFSTPIQMSFEGRKFVRDDGEPRFLVTRITSLSVPLDFHAIEVTYPGGQAADPNLRLPPRKGRLIFDGGPTALMTGHAPSPSRRPTSLSSGDVALPGSSRVKITNRSLGGSSPSAPLGIPADSGSESLGSTADRSSASNPQVGRVVVQRGHEMNLPSTSARDRVRALEATWDALTEAAFEQGWGVVPFPRRPIASAAMPFDFANDILLAEIETDDDFVVITDAGSSEDQQRSLAVLVPLNGANLSNSGAEKIRRVSTLLDGRWGSRRATVEGFRLYAQSRPDGVWDDRDAYVRLLARWIDEALGQ